MNAVADLLTDPDEVPVTRLGVDEHRYRSVRFFRDPGGGWRRYEPWMTAFVDADTGRVLGVVDGRDFAGVGAWLAARTPSWREGVEVVADELGRAMITCHHPALVMDQVPRHVIPSTEWDGAPGVYVLTGTQLEHVTVRTGVERTLTMTSIVKPWAYVGLSEECRGRLSSHRQSKPEWRRALLVRSAAHPFSSDDLRYLELAIYQALEATEEVMLAQTTPRGNLSAQPRSTTLLDACASTVVAVLRLTGTLI